MVQFKLAVAEYRLAEREVLKMPAEVEAGRLATYAHGEALADLTKRIETLKAQDFYQELIVGGLDVRQVVLRTDDTAGVLISEKCVVRTYRRTAEGDRLVNEETYDGDAVYGLIKLDARWKVERIRRVGGAGS